MLTEEQCKQIEEDIDNMSDEEFSEKFLVDKGSIDSPWNPSKQNSFYLCWYCGENGNAHLCTDGMGRGFCPDCRERAEKEFLDWDNPRKREEWQDE